MSLTSILRSRTPTRKETLLKDFSVLPPVAPKQVEDFVAFLRLRNNGRAVPRRLKPSDISKESFVGMWEGREDMQDSTTWVRDIRHTHWAKRNA